MTWDPSNIDPEVLALLNEAIADPESRLMRAPAKPLASMLGLREEAVSGNSSSLTEIERHLVQWGREELAELLYEASKLCLEDETVFCSREPGVPEGWRTRLEKSGTDECSTEVKLVEQVFSGAEKPRAADLATASLRVLPSDATRMLLALCLNRDGQADAALEVLGDVLAHHPSAQDWSHAHANRGLIMAGRKRFEAAREQYQLVSMSSETPGVHRLKWIVFAMRSGHQREALEAVQCMTDHPPTTDSVIDSVVSHLNADICSGFWFPTRGTERTAQSVSQCDSKTARSLAQVVSHEG